jgi:hypothetical protein
MNVFFLQPMHGFETIFERAVFFAFDHDSLSCTIDSLSECETPPKPRSVPSASRISAGELFRSSVHRNGTS